MSRRQFLWHSGGGLGGIALAALLERTALGAEPSERSARSSPSKLSELHFPPRAKRVVQLFMAGAASHIDLWDYKPELIKRHGQPSDFGEPVEAFQDGLGPWKRPVWDFHPHGQCGKMLGEVVTDLGSCVDDIAFIHNMVGKTGVHSQATLLQATGFNLPGFPGVGCWISYGLGSMNDNLPTFVVLPDHRGLASNGAENWDAAFLPSEHAGTVIYPQRKAPIEALFPHPSGDFISQQSESSTHQLLAELNATHARSRSADARLESRIRSYELAARMQLAAPEAVDISQEPQHVLDMYGIAPEGTVWPSEINALEEMDHFGRKCLLAPTAGKRRAVRSGVVGKRQWFSAAQLGFARGCAARPWPAGTRHGTRCVGSDTRPQTTRSTG